MTYPVEYRRKVLAICKMEDLTISEVALCWNGNCCQKRIDPQRTHYKPAVKIDRIALARDVTEFPDTYYAKRALRLSCSEKGIEHALKRVGVT